MAWSLKFRTALAESVLTPVYRLRVQQIDGEPYAGDYVVSSSEGYGEDEVLIAVEGPTISGPRLSPGTWSSTIGQFSVPLVGSVSTLLTRVTRGTGVVLEMGFAGWSTSDFETIAFGQVWSMAGADPSWVLVCNDALAVLRSRLTTILSRLALFYGVGNTTTTLSSIYTVGDTAIDVASTSGFQRETGGKYAVKVTVASSGAAFYLIATGSTATTFTGCSDGSIVVWDEDTETYVSALADAAIGDEVTSTAYLEGHPLDIVRRLLLSDDATNGEWDDYPSGWGWGIPQSLVDDTDIGNWKAYVVKVSSGSYTWQVILDEEVGDPYNWLSGLLADAGMFLTVRMGILTCRAGQLHVSVTAAPYMCDLEIVDADIASARVLSLWDTNAAEYGQVAATTATGTLTVDDAIQTLPASEVRPYDVSDRVFQNESAVRNDLTGRLTESSCRVPEAVELVLVGLRFAELCPGDIVPVTTPRLKGRLDSTRDGYDGRRVLVIQVSPDFPGYVTTVVALAYPTDETEFGG